MSEDRSNRMIEAAKRRTREAEAAQLERFERLRPYLGGHIPGEHERIVLYINRQIDLIIRGIRTTEDKQWLADDLKLLRDRRERILKEAESRRPKPTQEVTNA